MDPSTLRFGGALGLVLIAGLTWFAFIRPVPEQSAFATIISKGNVSGRTFVQQRTGSGGVPTTPDFIPIAPSNAFELRVDGMRELVRASFNETKSRAFEPGQRVQIRYVRRGLPPLWQRLTVTEMIAADSQ